MNNAVQDFANGPITLENMRIIFRNFEGRKGEYNRNLNRTFSVSIPPEMAEDMQAAGLNVKPPKPDSEYPDWRLEVTVSNGPEVKSGVRIFLVDGANTRRIDTSDQNQLAMLDTISLSGADLVLNPYHWEVNQGGELHTGIKTYLRAAYLKLWSPELNDPFAAKYGVAPAGAVDGDLESLGNEAPAD